ncbi:hypothetical protein E1B28_002116 [Marasmius oreades]|uniref:7alpha-cephem-methoxylase P8 chain n=1 Tax=Marasmius oreades TaxID=181124 RepID=A0A9P7RLZ2_9AGAR|nr:uncharacterized protein E1B28_002116 [Marasmius oreades]KAG7086156.1 hypothetical protein E1B28_002116 [Marasmius oreades]
MTVTNTVTAELSYVSLPSDGSQPLRYLTKPPEGVPVTNYKEVKHLVPVENVRGQEDKFTLDTSGFQFSLNQPTKVKTFTDDKEVEEKYYPESVEVIKKATGASKVFIFDHTVRRRIEGEAGIEDPKRRGPAATVHVDQTPSAAVSRAHRYFASLGNEEEAERLLKKRFQIINLWRPITHPADDRPLALCDFRSTNPEEDLVRVELVFPERDGETYGVVWNPGHQWKYLKGMKLDEVILIKCYDSVREEGIATMTPHTAFADPSTPEGSPPRESIELRALVFYE